MTWVATRLAAIAVAIVLPALMIACGGDDGPTGTPVPTPTPNVDAPTYFANLEEALTTVNAQLTEVDQLRADAFAVEGTSGVLAYGQAYEDFVTERDTVVHELIAPPPELAVEHAALGTATGDTLEFGQTLNSRIQAAPPANEGELSTLVQELEGPNATQSYRDACTQLQVYTTNEGIDVDLQCLR